MKKKSTNKFITFEGGEGSGKSTQSKMLYNYLKSKNIPVDLTREVGGTKIAEKMRNILIHDKLLPMSELLQIMSARYEHMHKRIIPKLLSGTWVICDRFIDSTACYQGIKIEMDLIYSLHKKLISEIMPDYTFWINVNNRIALSRSYARGNINRFEKKNNKFHNTVNENFHTVSLKFSNRIIRIDSETMTPKETHALILRYCYEKNIL